MTANARSQRNRLAVLIDAENISASGIEPLLSEIENLGIANIRRAYGDWTTPGLGPWKNILNGFAIQPIQQFPYTTGKNACDIALTIDAMDLLHSAPVDGFCLVSSDSDFTRLACRIRESGLSVYGFGARTTPVAFVKACTRFTYLESLIPPIGPTNSVGKSQPGSDPPVPTSTDQAVRPLGPKQIKLIRSAYEALAPEGGWLLLSALGSQVLKVSPSFQSKTYGFQKLSELIASLKNDFQIEHRSAVGKNPVLMVKIIPPTLEKP